MRDRYSPLPQGPGSFPCQAEVHPMCSAARSEALNYWDPCPPNSHWWQYLPHVNNQETPSIISDAANPHTAWPQSVEGLTARSPSLSQRQVLEQPFPSSLTFVPRKFDESLSNQAGTILNHNTHAGYNQYITIQKECSGDTNSYSSDVHSSQVPRQQPEWEELKGVRQDPDAGSVQNSKSHGQAPREVHPCTKFNCSKAYRRAQDLKRHTRDKHEWKRICPFCNARWSRPERIRAHLMKRHKTRLTKNHQQAIHFLQGREDTIRFLEKYGNTTPPTHSPDQLTPRNTTSSGAPAVNAALVETESGGEH